MTTAIPRRKLDERETKRLEEKARARVTWGDTRQDVERLVRTQGLDGPAAKRMVDKLFAERRASIRKRGVNDLASGAGLMVLSVGAILVLAGMRRIPIYGVAFLALGVMWGGYLLVRGFGRVQNPDHERTADTIFNS